MNRGTIIRAILGIVSIILTGIAIFTAASAGFRVIVLIYDAAAIFVNHWYNNDYSQEHREATGLARLKIKERKQQNFIGERFFEETDEVIDYE